MTASYTTRWDTTENETFVRIVNSGFKGDAGQVASQAVSSTEGFTIALAGLKALLEHKISLNLVFDRFPDAHVQR